MPPDLLVPYMRGEVQTPLPRTVRCSSQLDAAFGRAQNWIGEPKIPSAWVFRFRKCTRGAKRH